MVINNYFLNHFFPPEKMDLRKTNLNNFQKGTLWECAFSLHSATTDTAHVPWFYHCFATIDNFCLGFLQWLNKTKIQKNKKPRNQKTTKTSNQKKQKIQNGKTHSLPLLPPLGCAISFFFFVSCFFFCFLGFLVSCFLVRCWFFEGLRT